jgi:hypothetical protein
VAKHERISQANRTLKNRVAVQSKRALGVLPVTGAALVMALLAARAAAQTCEVMQGDEIRELVAALDASAAAGAAWGDYTIGNHPVVLISQTRDTAAAACAAVWRYREPLEVIPLSRGMRLSTPLYAMWNADPLGPNPTPGNGALIATLRAVPRELETALRARGDNRVVILPAPLRYEDLGALGQALRSMNIKTKPMLVQLAIHESYHLHSQFPTWLDQPRRYPWPAWDVQPDRKVLVQRCYAETSVVAETHRRELAALREAWLLLMGDRDSASDDRARTAARAFVTARRERYALLNGVTIPSPVGAVTCERAEDIMELEEGAPQWIGYVTTWRAGVIRTEEVGRGGAEAFYASGTFQLWILERLIGPEAMRALTTEISRSTDPASESGAIFARFSSHISRP